MGVSGGGEVRRVEASDELSIGLLLLLDAMVQPLSDRLVAAAIVQRQGCLSTKGLDGATGTRGETG